MKKDEAIQKIVQGCYEHGIFKVEEIQYIIATVEHETNETFKPVREAYWVHDKFIRKYGIMKGAKLWIKWAKSHFITPVTKKAYFPYYGRGFAQITWKDNYAKLEKILNIPLVENPDLALDFDVSLKILIYGMKHGTFTGKKLSDYFNHNGSDFIGARKIINGRDKAEKIAKMAQRIRIRNV
jgi:hypothetical protein